MGTFCPISSGAVSLLGHIVSDTHQAGENSLKKSRITQSNLTFIPIAINAGSLEHITLGWTLIAILIAIINLWCIPISYASRT